MTLQAHILRVDFDSKNSLHLLLTGEVCSGRGFMVWSHPSFGRVVVGS